MTTTPSLESLQHSDRYAAISQRLLRQAQEQLNLGDLIQASEKAWGAAAHAVKAVAEKWGWYHQAHYRLNAAVTYIAIEQQREELIGLYRHPAAMHINYYDNELYEDELQIAINSTQTFVAEMEKIRAETAAPFPPPQTLPRPQARRLRLLTTQPKDYAPRLNDISLLPPVEPEPPESL